MTLSSDQKYACYVQIYTQLDALVWRMPALLSAGITLVFTLALGSEEQSSSFVWVVIFIFSGVTALLGSYGIHRIRYHQVLVGDELRKIEDDGYFHIRRKLRSQGWVPKIPILYISFFLFVGIMFLFAACLITAGNDKILNLLQIDIADPKKESLVKADYESRNSSIT